MKPWKKRVVLSVVLVLIAGLFSISPILTNTVYGARVVNGDINRDTALLDVTGPLSPEAWDGISVGGYTSQPSVEQGGDIDLHISTDKLTYTLNIYREGATRQLMAAIPLSGSEYTCTDGYLPPGCGWPVAYTLHVPTDWPSGVYVGDIPTTVRGRQHLIFWVRENAPASISPILFLSSINTYQANTNFGGKSFFDYSSSDNVRSPILSFNRPFRGDGYDNWDLESLFVAWAENEGYSLEYATTYDLQHFPSLLDPYQVVVIAGHSEFWSWDMRQRLKAFIQNGGRLINLTGNAMWWQIRYEDEDRTIINYQDPALDPVTTQQGVTSLPWDFPILDIESAITGVHWKAGGNYGATSTDPTFTHADGYGGYWVQHSDHWVFAGTGISDGGVFGRVDTPASDVLGNLSDGTTFNCATDGNTILGPVANMGTPSNFTILGLAPVARNLGTDLGFATMGIYTVPSGGAVFAGSTTGWVFALSSDPQVAQVTRNVLDHFLAGDFPSEPVSSLDTEYFFIDRFNCNNLDHTGVLPSYTGPKWYEGVPTHNYILWTGDVSKVRYTNACGVGGGSGLELTIAPDFQYESQIKPNWQTTDVLYTRVYLDFSNLVMADNDQFILVKYLHEEREAHSTQADLRVRRLGGQFYVRFVDYLEPSGTWVLVPGDRPFMLETKWDKPHDQISMWIDGTRYDWSVGLSARLGNELNRVDLVLNALDVGTSGHICLDELAFADQKIGSGLLPVLKVYMPFVQN